MPSLEWIGKSKVVNHHLDVPYHVLNLSYNFGTDSESENKIIHGDNLLALKSLLPEYENRVKCIYIDPPYNTGNEGWIYNDNVNDPRIRKWLGEVVGKEGEDLSRHDKWLCMMYPRLKLLKRLLADDGAIFISIDDNEQANLKLVCDEIFGAQNFCSSMVWKNKSGGANDVKGIACDTENILVYAKNISSCKFNYDTDAKVSTSYNYVDSYGRRYGLERLDKQSLGYQESLDFPIIGTDGKIYTVEHKNPNAKKARWRWSKSTVAEKYDELVFKFPYVYTKNYEKDSGTIPRNLLVDERFGRTRTGKTELAGLFDGISIFSFPKPTKLIQYLVGLITDKDSIILDSFAGSGTTAHAVLNLNAQDGGNRKFILVEMMDYAENITAERVRRVIDGYGKTAGTGGNFSYYELGSPLMIEESLNEDVDIDSIRKYVYFTETKNPLPSQNPDEPYYLGTHADTAYYFYYDRDEITTLSLDFLATIQTRAESYVIYADLCTISEKELIDKHITFRKIPRDIHRI